jgi:hypothetical protein
MTDDIKSDVEAHQRELIESAATLYAVQKVYGDKVREQSKAAYPRLVDAHLLITGVLATGLLRTNGKITPITGSETTDFDPMNCVASSFVSKVKMNRTT